ncbi:predicted protein [Meyerozyma guilliermondii ATCC 6260]|uniref:Uncharacterized protein n=1 Tax=Meyerozyma guilliermondii (strain ATCC 6260 / CBS 566 / DSM 6381 / JCM 1539 / NBRC 10279 / NRRL Y-324) TaxID=294746 RepID=A5DEC4_PICGU|nr:uncharacterized protein PGUG_01625 [Meyerozyma guilliermondii ATCC 6260]EDK37527.2 predicted protein [Meyerozyma guilliermondii ATCC 6260]
MADSDASKPRSGWFQWASRRLWRLGRPGRRPVVSENEEKYNGNNLPTIGAPVALVHEKREDKNPSETAFRRINKATVGPELQEKESVDLERSKKLAELEKLVNDLKSSAARNTVSTGSSQTFTNQTGSNQTSINQTDSKQAVPDATGSKQAASVSVISSAPRVLPVQKPRPNVFTNTLNKRAQELLIRDLQNASAAAIAKQRGLRQKSKITKPGSPSTISIPRPTVPTMGRGPKVYKKKVTSSSPRPAQNSGQNSAQNTTPRPSDAISPASSSALPPASSSASPSAVPSAVPSSSHPESLPSSSVPQPSPKPRIVLTGFDKLVSNKREKEIAERMRMSRPTISIQSIVRTNNTGPPQTKDVDSTQTKEVEENTSFGEEFYHSWVNGTPRDNVPHTKKVKAIRINPSSSEGSRSPSPTGTKPSKVDKKEKRLFVYSDSEDEEVEEVSNHQSDDAPVAKRQKPSSSSQVAVITQHTPNKNLVTLPPIAHLQQSTPNQVVLPPIRNLNTKFQSSPQPQPPTPQNVEHRLQLKSVGPRSSPIAARYSQSSSSQNSYASSQSVQNTPVQFERPRVLPIKSNSRQIADVMRDRYSQTENTNVNGQLS